MTMSLLTKREILGLTEEGALRFTPELDAFQVQAHAVDLRLGFTFLIVRHWDLTEQGRIALQLDHLQGGSAHFEAVELKEGQVFDILPGEYVLVSTLEAIHMPDDVMATMYPRSSVNRQGLSVDLSGIVDAGYEGHLIIPVRNNNLSNVVRVYPGERFCQLTFTRLLEPVEVRKSRYHQRTIATGVLPEQHSAEIDLVRSGNIAELKRRFNQQKGAEKDDES
jgi:dCTP deaminase